MSKIAVYPGTFDPITNGHMDIIRRASMIFDQLIVAVAKDTSKNPLFDIEERRGMVQAEIFENEFDCFVEVKRLDGLLVDFAAKNSASVIVRGLRAVSDFEYEFQMYGMNSKLNSEIQTIFLPASENNNYIASRLVKEAARLGGNIEKFVSPYVEEKLLEKLKQ